MTETTTLANGLRLAADPMPGVESVAVGLWVGAGSVDETPHESGAAHLLEHMAFKGTATRSARVIAETIESVGGSLDAATTHQRTGYFARVLHGDLLLALDLLHDIVFRSTFDEGELAKEREVVLQEIREARDTPDDAVFDDLQALVFRDHPLGRPILGAPRAVASMSRQKLLDFIARKYSPSNIVLAASGKVDPDAFFRDVAERFSEVTGSGTTAAEPPGEAQAPLKHTRRRTEQTHLAVAWRSPSARSDDYLAARVLSEAYGGGMSSRLFQSIREDRGLAYSVYSFCDGFDSAGMSGAYAALDAASAEEAARLMRNAMEGLAERPDPGETARAKALLRASLLMGLESAAARVEAIANQIFVHGRPIPPAETLERLDAISTNDIARMARQALDAPWSVAIVGPANAGVVVAATR